MRALKKGGIDRLVGSALMCNNPYHRYSVPIAITTGYGDEGTIEEHPFPTRDYLPSRHFRSALYWYTSFVARTGATLIISIMGEGIAVAFHSVMGSATDRCLRAALEYVFFGILFSH